MPRPKTPPKAAHTTVPDPDLGAEYDDLDPDFDTDTEDPMQREHDRWASRMAKALERAEARPSAARRASPASKGRKDDE